MVARGMAVDGTHDTSIRSGLSACRAAADGAIERLVYRMPDMPTTRVPPADGSLPRPGVVMPPSRLPRRVLTTRGRSPRIAWPTLAALLLVTLALPLPLPGASPAAAARASSPRDGDAGWAARAIEAGGARQRDRALLAGLPAATMLAYHPETGRVRLLSGTPGRPLTDAPVSITAGERRLSVADARARARRFVERYGGLFGLASPARELRAGRVHRHLTLAPAARRVAAASGAAGDGAAVAPSNLSVRFDQVRDGVPVLGGQIVVQLSGIGDVISAAGEVLPSSASVPAQARLSASQASAIAATWLAREAGRPASSVSTRSEGLTLFDSRLMDVPAAGARGARLAWRIDAQLPGRGRTAPDRRLIVVDARLGHVLSAIGRVYEVDRFVCDNRSIPGRSYRCGPPYAREEGQPSSGVADVDAAYRLMGVYDDFLASRFGRDGLDGRGDRLKATVRYCASYGCPWRNAQWKWDSQQAIFGTGWSQADDIVAHELTHGLLDHEVPLFYQYQSGAINESLADVFGELVDLSNVSGGDTAASAWRIGEDTPVGAFRDMQEPGRFGHPDRMRSARWHISPADDGGVHRNSGVGNKTAALIADGGRFRGYRIAGIGRTRTARLYYQALTTRLTPAANYIDLADALVAACADLAGRDGMTLAHCASVREATKATQMHLPPSERAPRRAPVCAAGRHPVDVFADDLEDPAAGRWLSQRLVGTRKGWYYPQNPNDDPSWDATWASSGSTNFYAPNLGTRSDTVMQTRSPILVPERAFLRFEHGYSFDAGNGRRYDGGIVEVRIDGGPLARREDLLHARRLQRPHRSRARQPACRPVGVHRATRMAGPRPAWTSGASPGTG